MKYSVLSLILASSAAFADTPVQASDKQKAANDQLPGMSAPDNSHRNSNPAQGNVLPNAARIAAAPPNLSALQYQPQPFQQNQPSPIQSQSSPMMVAGNLGLRGAMRWANCALHELTIFA